MVKLVDTPDLGSGAVRRGGSSPSWRTICKAALVVRAIRQNGSVVPNANPPRRILIIDDHPVYLDGISHILQSILGNVEILQAHSGREAIAQVSDRIDIEWIFLDQQLPDTSGLDLLEQFNALRVAAPVVMMSGSDDVALIHDAMERGASGFIHKAFGRATFEQCLNAIQLGDTYLPPELRLSVDHFRDTVVKARNVLLAQLSDRRREVLIMMAEGYTNGEMATALGIAEATVKTHVSALLSIFDVDNRSHCIAEARKLGLLK